MKLSEYIKNLSNVLEKNGDTEVVYSVDEEGNYYKTIYYEPTLGHYEDGDFTPENCEDFDDREINSVCVN